MQKTGAPASVGRAFVGERAAERIDGKPGQQPKKPPARSHVSAAPHQTEDRKRHHPPIERAEPHQVAPRHAGLRIARRDEIRPREVLEIIRRKDAQRAPGDALRKGPDALRLAVRRRIAEPHPERRSGDRAPQRDRPQHLRACVPRTQSPRVEREDRSAERDRVKPARHVRVGREPEQQRAQREPSGMDSHARRVRFVRRPKRAQQRVQAAEQKRQLRRGLPRDARKVNEDRLRGLQRRRRQRKPRQGAPRHGEKRRRIGEIGHCRPFIAASRRRQWQAQLFAR